MSLSKLWNLMSKYTFVFSDESEHTELRCVMCKNIMVDAVVSNVCGCHYCYNCIIEYINREEKCCPGGKQFCKDEIVKLGENAVKSSILNKRISILNAKCPNESCDCYVELIKMEDHLRLCTKQPMGCPYVVIGCISEMSNKDEIGTHLHSDTTTHSELLIELIMNLKNEVSGLKDDFAACKLEIDFLKAQLIAKEERNSELEKENETNKRRENEAIENLKIFLNNLTKEMKDGFEKNKYEISFLKEDLLLKENIIMDLKKESREMRNEMDIKMKAEKDEREKEMEKQRKLIEDSKVKNRIATLEKELEEVKNGVTGERDALNIEINKLRKQIGDAEIARENVAKLLNKTRKDNDKIRGDFEKMRKERNINFNSRMMNKYNKLYPNISADFVWRFDGVSKNMDKDMWSESFYSNNYKLCLHMYINSFGDIISLLCYMMKGDNDEKVEWPLRRTVTLSIIDQNTLENHKSETYQSRINRPTTERGGYVGNKYNGFIEYSSIKDNSSVVSNDCIIVSCVISDP